MEKNQPGKLRQIFNKVVFNKYTLGIAFAFTAAAGLEFNGYRLFDRDQGENILCQVDSNCRHLTEGEIELARSVFGDMIDYNKVKIFDRPYFGYKFGHYGGLAPNGNIYETGSYKSDDYSKAENEATKSHFIHEMAHVWQYYNGANIRSWAIAEFIKNGFEYDVSYSFNLSKTEDFADLNIEQQASLIAKYVAARDKGWGVQTYEKILEPYLPLGRDITPTPIKFHL